MPYRKPILEAHDVTTERACCSGSGTCEVRSPPPPEPCGVGLRPGDDGSWTIFYNVGGHCFG